MKFSSCPPKLSRSLCARIDEMKSAASTVVLSEYAPSNRAYDDSICMIQSKQSLSCARTQAKQVVEVSLAFVLGKTGRSDTHLSQNAGKKSKWTKDHAQESGVSSGYFQSFPCKT